MKRANMLFAACVAVLLCVGQSRALDRLYVISDDGVGGEFISVFDGLPRGNSGFAGPGDTNILDADTNVPGISVLDASDVSNEVIVGGILLQKRDIDGNYMMQGGPINGAGLSATALEFGSLGPGNYIVASHDLTAPANSSQVLIFNAALGFINTATIPNVETATDIDFGDLVPSIPGNEYAVSTFSTTGFPGVPGFVVKFSFDGGTATFLDQQNPNSSTAAIAIGDLFPDAPDDLVLTGANPGLPALHGQGTMAFSGQPAGNVFEWEVGMGGAEPPVMNVVEIGNVSSTAGNEVVAGGNGEIRIIDSQSGSGSVLQTLATNQNIVDLVLADVFDNDGVLEIVAIASGGLILAFEHDTPGDISTPFVLDPANNKGGVYNAGSGVRTLIAIDKLTSPIPEPTTALLMLFGLIGVAGIRRR